MKLAPNFTLAELVATNHRRYAQLNASEARQHETLERLRRVAGDLLQPIRDHFGAPVVVNSGYRCRPLNLAIGGSLNSQHCKGEAADFYVLGVDLVDVFEWVWRESSIRFGQLILEGHQRGRPTWIHISLGAPYREAVKSGHVLRYDAGAWSTLARGVRVEEEG